MRQEDVDSAIIANTLENSSLIKAGYVVSFSLSGACRRKLVGAAAVAPTLCAQISGALALSMLWLLPCSKVLPLVIWSKIAHRAVVRRKGGRKEGIPLSFESKIPKLQTLLALMSHRLEPGHVVTFSCKRS